MRNISDYSAEKSIFYLMSKRFLSRIRGEDDAMKKKKQVKLSSEDSHVLAIKEEIYQKEHEIHNENITVEDIEQLRVMTQGVEDPE